MRPINPDGMLKTYILTIIIAIMAGVFIAAPIFLMGATLTKPALPGQNISISVYDPYEGKFYLWRGATSTQGVPYIQIWPGATSSVSIAPLTVIEYSTCAMGS